MLALGLVETRGLLAAIEGADAMLKAADVRLLEKNLASGGLVTITVAGEVSAVQASVDAARACILRIAGAELVSTHVIPRPDEELTGILLLDPDRQPPVPPAAPEAPLPPSSPSDPEPVRAFVSTGAESISVMPQAVKTVSVENAPSEARLKKMSLNRLRQMAWSMDGLSMSEEAVASADKKSLIAAIMRTFRKIEE